MLSIFYDFTLHGERKRRPDARSAKKYTLLKARTRRSVLNPLSMILDLFKYIMRQALCTFGPVFKSLLVCRVSAFGPWELARWCIVP